MSEANPLAEKDVDLSGMPDGYKAITEEIIALAERHLAVFPSHILKARWIVDLRNAPFSGRLFLCARVGNREAHIFITNELLEIGDPLGVTNDQLSRLVWRMRRAIGEPLLATRLTH